MPPKSMRVDGGPSIPWPMIEPHEAQALKNHGQTLERLNERGGLDVCEALAILTDRKYRDVSEDACRDKLVQLIDADLRTQVAALTSKVERLRRCGQCGDAIPDPTQALVSCQLCEDDIADDRTLQGKLRESQAEAERLRGERDRAREAIALFRLWLDDWLPTSHGADSLKREALKRLPAAAPPESEPAPSEPEALREARRLLVRAANTLREYDGTGLLVDVSNWLSRSGGNNGYL